jgi:hypothetical protein
VDDLRRAVEQVLSLPLRESAQYVSGDPGHAFIREQSSNPGDGADGEDRPVARLMEDDLGAAVIRVYPFCQQYGIGRRVNAPLVGFMAGSAAGYSLV